MKSLNRYIILLAVSILSLTQLPTAHADSGRMDFHLFAGGGMKRTALSVAASDSTSHFNGWGGEAEAGVRLPLFQDILFSLAGTYGISDTLNAVKDNGLIETGTLKTIEERAGFHYGIFGLGGGLRQLSLAVKTVSTDGSASLRNVEGQSSFGFLNLSFDYQNRIRTVLEGQYHAGEFDTYKVSEISGALKLLLLLDI